MNTRALTVSAARTVFALLLSATAAGAQSTAKAKSIWTGKSGSYAITWTGSNLRVTQSNGGKVVFDAATDAKSAWSKLVHDANGKLIEASWTYRLLSAIGPYLSIEKTSECDCGGAHPSAFRQFYAIDLDHTTPASWQPALLTDIFAEPPIVEALAHDSVVSGAIKPQSLPASLSAFVGVLQDKTVKVRDCSYEFSAGLLQNFAVYDVSGGNALVRLALPASIQLCRGDLTQLGLSLPIAADKAAQFSDAKDKRAGLLMIDSRRIARSAVTSFTFTNNK